MKEKLFRKFIKYTHSLQRWPSYSDLLKIGLTRNKIRHHFGSINALKKLALQTDKTLNKLNHFNDQVFLEQQEKVKKYKKFVVTTAVAGAPVDKKFLDSIKTYCQKHNALLLTIPANYQLYEIDPKVKENSLIVFRPIKLNKNVTVYPIKIDPKQVDPAQGLEAIGKKEKTIIIGSPKQRRITLPVNNTHTTIIQSTGAITKPRYIPKDGVPKRRDTLATVHHVMGAIVVEIENEEIFHFRQIEMSSNGSFVDLCVRYSPNGKITQESPSAIVLGDYHVTETDYTSIKPVENLIVKTKPKFVVFHDFFSGVSINHHEENNFILQAKKAQQNKLSLEEELKACVQEIKEKIKTYPKETKLLFVKSNHDEFLNRYLSRGVFDPINRSLALSLSLVYINGQDPLVFAYQKFGLNKNELKRIVFLTRDNNFKISGVFVGHHGDIGLNGKKNPGIKSMFKSYGKIVTGHTHTAEIWHEAMSVGTSSKLKLGYNIGPSTWTHTHCIIYKDGTRQLINIIDGRFSHERSDNKVQNK